MLTVTTGAGEIFLLPDGDDLKKRRRVERINVEIGTWLTCIYREEFDMKDYKTSLSYSSNI